MRQRENAATKSPSLFTLGGLDVLRHALVLPFFRRSSVPKLGFWFSGDGRCANPDDLTCYLQPSGDQGLGRDASAQFEAPASALSGNRGGVAGEGQILPRNV